MADGTQGLQDAEIIPNPNEKPQKVNVTENEPRKSTKPSETKALETTEETTASLAEIRQKIKQLDETARKTEGIEPTAAPVEQTAKAQKPEKPIEIENRPEKYPKPNALVEKTQGFKMLFNTHLVGNENIETIPLGKNVIIVTTHISNFDGQIAISVLGKIFKNIAAAEESTHWSFRQDPINYLGRLIGPQHSFRVDYDSGAEDRQGEFNPDNFTPMKKSLETGKPLVITAHYDPANSGKNSELSKKAGNGAAYLAQITENAIILPVAVDIKTNGSLRSPLDVLRLLLKSAVGQRAKADVIVGKPFVPDRIEKINRLVKLLQKRKLTPLMEEERTEYLGLKNQLKKQSKIIMQHLAELLPPEKRGVWG